MYNYKHENKDSSKHFVCNIPGCYSSLTLFNDGKKIDINTELVHVKHESYTAEDIIGMNFVKISCKTRIANEN